MSFFIKKSKSNFIKGYSIVEILFYISIFAILTLAVINALITMTKAFREVTVQSDLVTASSMIERISREIRQSLSINNISASDLKLNTKDDLGNSKTVRFAMSGSNLQFYENDVLTGNLNTTNTVVTDLSFAEITTVAGKAIKLSISVRSARDPNNRVETFYDSIVLRGDY
jgi:type II secretory pathway pseudopilin PulG